MSTKQKNGPGGKTGADKVRTLTSRKPPKASLKKRQQPAGPILARAEALWQARQVARQLERQRERKVARRWLHVSDDGSEFWYTREPPRREMKTLAVYFIDIGGGRLVQQADTFNIGEPGTFALIRCVKPRGEGWRIHNDNSDSYTVWRRPHTGGVP